MYLTNEVFLYRVVGFLVGRWTDFVELEDCYTLDVVRVAMNDLRERRLRVVTPSADRGASPAESDCAIREGALAGAQSSETRDDRAEWRTLK